MNTEDHGVEAAIEELEREPRRHTVDGIGWIVVAFMLGAMCMGLLFVGTQLDDANSKILTNAAKIDRQNELLKESRTQFFECTGKKGENNPACVKPVVPPVTITPIRPGDSSKQKVLTESEVEAIAATVVAKQKYEPTQTQYQAIARIAIGLIPQEPTRTQISNIIKATVASYCAADRCKGKDAPTITPSPGKDGEPGQPGADSTVPGPEGSPGADATDSQVRTQVEAFCAANNDCKGPKGDQGRGLVSLTCNEEGQLVATYDQEPTTQVIANSDCRVKPGPTVTVTETVPPIKPPGQN